MKTLSWPALEPEVGEDAVVADVLVVVSRRGHPSFAGESRVLDLETRGHEMGQDEVLEPVRRQVLDPDLGDEVEPLRDLVDGQGVHLHVAHADVDREPL